MFSTSNKLIENISNEFHINDEESNQIINKLFQKVTFSILNGNRFYMDKLGIISLNENKEILFSNEEDGSFDDSLESISITSKDIKDIFLEKSIYKSIFKNIKDISKEEKVHIENFGTFLGNKITFEADKHLKDIINNYNNEEVVEDILEELYNQIISKRAENKNDENLEEIVEEDNNIISDIWKNKSYNNIDLNSMIKNLNEKNDTKEEVNNNEINNNIEEKEEVLNVDNNSNLEDNSESQKTDNENSNYSTVMKEYTEEELLDINNFDSDDLKDENKEDDKSIDYPVMKEYTKEELLDPNNIDADDEHNTAEYNREINEKVESELLSTNKKQFKEINRKNMDNMNNSESKKSKSSLIGGIFKVACIIIFILIIGAVVSVYYGSNKQVAENNIENQKLYDIVDTFFNDMDSVNLSYITSKDMYYWDIAKSLYGDATYWPLIYSYNNDKYKISNIIKKGSSISYRNMPSFYAVKDVKYLDNTLSKCYMAIYPILVNDKKFNHALWALKLSAYYDLNVFKNNSNMIPQKTYSNILKENSSTKSAYSDIIKYGQLDENTLLSFVETIKEKLGMSK